MTDDTTRITQIILKERQGRDRGWFDQQAECFHTDSRVHITWFDGPGSEFVELSRQTYASGIRPNHRLAPPVVHLDGDRAVAEVSAELAIIQAFGSVDAYVISYVRLLYRFARIEGEWGITALDCIYERDTLVPVIVGETPKLDQEILGQFRRPYMYLGYHLHETGKQVRDDLYGDDRPEDVQSLYEKAFAWMHAEQGKAVQR